MGRATNGNFNICAILTHQKNFCTEAFFSLSLFAFHILFSSNKWWCRVETSVFVERDFIMLDRSRREKSSDIYENAVFRFLNVSPRN